MHRNIIDNKHHIPIFGKKIKKNTTRSILKLCDICHLTFHSVIWSFILWHDLLFYDLTFHSTIWPVILPSDLSLSSDLSFRHLTFHSTIWPVILPSDLSLSSDLSFRHLTIHSTIWPFILRCGNTYIHNSKI